MRERVQPASFRMCTGFCSLLLVILLSLLAGSCITRNTSPNIDQNLNPADPSCSYFYFLWGTQAEIHRNYDEALEAYEKALICDPTSNYIEAKIPILYLKMNRPEQATNWLETRIRQNPERYEYTMLLAGLYVRQEKIDHAIELYQQLLLRSDIDDEDIRLKLALLYSYKQQFDQAEKRIRDVLKRHPDSYFAHLSLARLFLQAGKAPEAGAEYEKAIALNWSRPLAFELGQYYLEQKQFEKALEIFTSMSGLDPQDERAALSQVQALLELKRDDEALARLENIAAFTRNRDRIDIITAKVLLRNKNMDAAIPLLESLVKRSRNSQALYMLSLIAYQEEDLPRAERFLERIEPDDDEFEEAVYLRTRIYKQQGRTDRSVQFLKTLLKDKEHLTPLYFMLLASSYQEKRRYNDALEILDQGIKTFPEEPGLHFEYGMVLERRGDSSGAMAKMEEVLHLDPDHAEALNYIGYTLADRNTELKKALRYIEKADQLKPGNPYIIDSLGWVYFRLGRFEEAARQLERSIKLLPDDPQIYEHLGDVYHALGKTEKAVRMYRHAVRGFDSQQKIDEVQKKIKALKHEPPNTR